MTTPSEEEARALTTDKVRGTFASHFWRETAVVPMAEAEAEFDRWLEAHDAALLASRVSTPPRRDEGTIDGLASDIRFVDGSHSLGAGALAEELFALGWRRPAVPVLPTEPATQCPKCGVKVTDQTPSAFYASHDETCGGDLSEPTEPEEKR